MVLDSAAISLTAKVHKPDNTKLKTVQWAKDGINLPNAQETTFTDAEHETSFEKS